MSGTTSSTPSHGRGTSPNADGQTVIDQWLADLRTALAADRTVRHRRILEEAADHLGEATADLEARGVSAGDAARTAVERLGRPEAYAARFRSRTGFDWAIDAARTVVPVLGWLLVAVGVLSTFRATLDWMLGHPMRGHGVRVWRTCPQSADGQCIGPWQNHYASSTLIVGAVLILVGLAVVLAAVLVRRRYSQREVFPGWAFWAGSGLLAALGAYLLVGGANRSGLDHSWYWVPFWAIPGVVCLLVSALAARHQRRLSR